MSNEPRDTEEDEESTEGDRIVVEESAQQERTTIREPHVTGDDEDDGA